MHDEPSGGPVLVGVAQPEDAQQLVRTAGDLAILGDGPSVPVETTVTMADDLGDATVDETAAHDVVVLGATRQGAIRR